MNIFGRCVLLLLGLLLTLPAHADRHRQELTDEQVAGETFSDLQGMDADIVKILADARLWSVYGNDCNMEHLGVRARKISEANMNLLAMRDSTLGTIMEMAENLREIFRGMESMFPGGPNAYDALWKPTRATLDKLGPYGAIAGQVADLLDSYKDWNNAEIAKEVAANVKAQAKAQVEALQAAMQRLQQIEQGLDETDKLLDKVLELMRTYPERCLGGDAVDTAFPAISELTTPVDVRTSVFAKLEGYDNCDLPEMIRLLAFLNLARANLESQLERVAGEILTAFNELNAELEKFEGALPKFEAKDMIKLLKGAESLGASLAKFDGSGSADFSGATPSEFLPLEELDAAVKRAEAEDALKKAAEGKMQKLRDLIATRDDIMATLEWVYKKQRILEREIETWEERCNPQPEDAVSMGDDFAGSEVTIANDSPEWCTYTTGTPTALVPTGGGTGTPVGPGGTTATPPGGGMTPIDPGGTDPGDAGRPPAGGVPTRALTPCERHLLYLRRAMAKEGKNLFRDAQTNPQTARDLAQIQERMRKLEAECGKSLDEALTPPAGAPGTAPPTDETGKPGPTITVGVPEDQEEPPPDTEDPADVGDPKITIYVKAKTTVAETQTTTAAPGQQIKLFTNATANVALPGPGVDKSQAEHSEEPIQGTTDDEGNLIFQIPGSTIGLRSTATAAGGTPALSIEIDTTRQASVNAQLANANTAGAVAALPDGLDDLLTDTNVVNGTGFLTFTFPATMANSVETILIRVPGVVAIEVNFCRDKQAMPNDPLFPSNQAWGQSYDNQWAIKQVGLTGDANSAWNLLGDNPAPVTVAVIDTGLDWNHLDLSWDNLWRNLDETPDNGIDDDNNGYVDDIIGWDFFSNTNKPWDHDGHGTFVSGVIAAESNNSIGMTGINPHARIMVLKALNNFGHTRASYLAKAIVYAVDNGARVINMSVGGKEISLMEREAIKYAASKGVVVVVASGNEGIDVSNFGIAGLEDVITVGATHFNDRRTRFSNYGLPIDIAAPGIEVLGLRARRTDTMRDIPGVEYEAGANYVGEDNRYYRASGTSFAAPIVTGVASLLISQNPNLSAAEVERLLLQNAKDVEIPGVDQYTGYGLVDARAALSADPAFFIDASIQRVEVVQLGGQTFVRAFGKADASDFDEAWLELGRGAEPTSWQRVSDGVTNAIRDGALGDVDANALAGATQWTLRVIVKHKNGKTREARFALNLG